MEIRAVRPAFFSLQGGGGGENRVAGRVPVFARIAARTADLAEGAGTGADSPERLIAVTPQKNCSRSGRRLLDSTGGGGGLETEPRAGFPARVRHTGIAAALLLLPFLAPGPAAAQTAGLTVVETSGSTATTEVSGAGHTDTFTVRLATQPTATVTIDISSSDIDEATVAPGTLKFAATASGSGMNAVHKWDDPQTVTVTGVDDDVDDGDQSYTITLDPSSPGSSGDSIYDGLSSATVSGTNTDEDMAGLTVVETGTPPATMTTERRTTDTFRVSLATQPTHDVTVSVTVGGDGTECELLDVGEGMYKSTIRLQWHSGSSTGPFGRPAWDTTLMVTVRGKNDNDADGDQPCVLTLDPFSSDDNYDDLPNVTVTVTNADDDPGLAVVETSGSTATTEAGGTDTFTVRLTTVPSGTVTIAISSSDIGEATVSPASLKFGATADSGASVFAWNDAQDVTVTGVDDAVDDDDQSYTITLDPSSTDATGNYNGLSDSTVSGTNADDEAAPTVTLSVAAATINESGSGNSTTVSATLNHASSAATTVTVTAVTGAYTVGSDATITIAAGDTANSSDTVTITAVNNNIDEGASRAVTVTGTASNSQGVTAAATGASLTITDDEAAPTVTLSVAAATINESGSGNSTTVSATLNHASSAATTVTVTAVSGAYTVGSDATITIAAGDTANSSDTVTITAVNNNIDEGASRAVTVTGTASNSQGVTAAATGASLTITDDEAAPTVTLSVAAATINESGAGNSTTVSATLNHASSAATTITVTAVSGAYTVGSDATITIAAGDTANSSDTVTITAVNNNIDEGASRAVTVTGTASNSQGVTAAATGASLTITDDEAAPTVTLSVAAATINESGSGNSTTVSATLNRASSAATTITVTAVSGAYTVGSDATITIAAGDTANSSDTVSITAVNNTRDEPNRSVTVTGSATNSQGVGSVMGASLTITDDDAAPTATLSVAAATINESGSGNSTTVSATLNHASSAATTVTVTAVSGAYTVGSDATITIAAGDTANSSDTVTITAVNNNIDEGASRAVTVTGTASNSQGVTAAATGASLTITDDEAAPTVTLSVAAATINESGSGNSTTVSATLNHASSAATTVTVTAVSGAYTVGSDATITIAAGDTANSSDTVTITAVNNNIDEGASRAVTVTGTASNSQGVTAAATGASLTIRDDDDPPSLSIGDASVTEGNSGTANLQFTVTLSPASGQQVTVNYAAAAPDSGTATSGVDYTAVSAGTLTFAAGDMSKTITVSVIGDGQDEPDETVKLTLSGAVNATVGTATGTGTIMDDDAAPTVTLSVAAATINESGSGNSTTVSATLNHASSAATTVTVTAVSGAYTVGSDATITIAAGDTANSSDTVTITAVNNNIDEGASRAVTVTGTASNSQGVTAAATGASLTITDDEAAPTVTLSVAAATINESGAGNSTTVSATLNHASSAATTVTVTAVSGAYTVGSDATITIAAGDTANSSDTVTITAVNNNIDEGASRAVTVTGTASNSQGVTAAATGASLTITDDEAAPTVTLSVAAATINESGSGNSTTVSATLNHASSAATTVTVTAVSGAYTVGSDATITIAAGDTANSSDTVTITAVNNNIDEGASRAVTVTGTASNSQGVTAAATGASLTITDDEAAPTVTLSVAAATINESGSGNSTTVSATLNHASSAATTITVTAVSGAYTVGSDATITIAAGDTANSSDTVTITAVNNNIDEGASRAVTVTGTASNNQGTVSVTGPSLTITDDDTAGLTVSENSVATSEAGTTDTFTVRLATQPTATVTVTISSSATGEATVAPGTLRFAATASGSGMNAVHKWDDRQTVTVTGVDDTPAAADGSKPYTITVAAASAGGDANYNSDTTVPDVVVSGTNADDESPTVTLSLSDDSIPENGGTTVVSATLDQISAAATTITVTAVPGAYTVGSDATITIAAGQTSNSSDTVTITAVDNSIDDTPDRTVSVTASASNTSSLGVSGPAGVSLTLEDDDAAGLTLTEAATPRETTEAGGTAAFKVALATQPTAAVTVTVSSDDDGECRVSKAGDAAPAALTTLTFTAATAATLWSTAQEVTVTGQDDDVDDGHQDCVITVAVSNTSDTVYNDDAQVVDRTVSVRNTDDDETGLVLSKTAVTTSEDGTEDTFTVKLSSAPSGDVTVAVTSNLLSEATVSPSSLTFSSTAWNTAQTVTVTGVDDSPAAVDGPKAYVITLDPSSPGPSGDSIYDGLSSVTVDGVNRDDEAPTVTLSLSSASIPENGGSATVTAHLDRTVPVATTVTVSATAPADADGATYFRLSENRTLTVAAGETASAGTVTIAAVDNSIDAPDRTVTVSGTSAGGQGAADPASLTLTITDDEEAPTVTLATATAEIWESGEGRSTTVSARLSHASSMATTITIQPVIGFYTVGADNTIVIPAGQTTSTDRVTITAVDNAQRSASDPTVTIAAAVDNDMGTGAMNAAAVVVLDDETASVTLSLSSASIPENGGSATVTAVLNRAAPAAVTVTVSAAGADGAAHFRLSENRTLTVAAGATRSAGTVTITAVDDAVDAPDRTVTVSGAVSSENRAREPEAVTLTIEDDEETPVATLALTPAVIDESGANNASMVSATLSHASSEATTITVSASGTGYAQSGTTLTIPALGTASAGAVTLTAVDDEEQAPDREVTVSGRAENAHGVEQPAAAALTIRDDETVSVSLELAPERVAEGAAARVAAVLSRAAPAAVTVTVSAAPGTAATAASFALGPARTLTVAAGATRSAETVTITAVDDRVDAPDRAVTVTGAVSSENRARVREPEAVTLTIEDDDETPVATLALTPAVIDESGANNASTVSATLSNPSSEETTITVSAQGAGYAQQGTTLTIPALGTASAGAVTLTAVDDEEQTPDREVTVSGRAENAHGVEQPATVVLTIRDDDGTEMVTEVLLPEAARAMADSRATAVRQRLERAGTEETAELPSLTGLLAQHGPSAQEDALEWKTLLPQASFALALDADGGGAGGGVTVWGGGDYRDLDGEARGVSWDGEVASAHLGADRLLANGMRVGVAASWSEAKFDYEHKGRSGDWELEMSSAQPYLGWTTAGGIDLWASAGVGSGELELSDAGGRQSSDADMWLAAAGARGPLYATDSGLQVSLRGEALYSSFEVDGNGSRIRGHTSDVSRLRLALEARRERTLASGARLSPRFELGLRHDGGDGETGAGLELGGGAEYVSGRLRLAGGARALAANSDYDEWGAEAALEYAAGADGRGLTLRLAPSWGATQSGAAQLWEQGAPGLDGEAAEPDLGGRLAAELGYGLKSPWSRGLLTLALGGELGEDEGVAARLSGRVAPDGTSALGLALELREPKSGATEYSLMLTGELRF